MPSIVLRQSMLKHSSSFSAEPESAGLEGNDLAAAGVENLMAAGVSRNCELEHYDKIESIPAVDVDQEIIAYCSPDSTYAVTKKLFDDAKKSILIGIYDFSATYMK